MFLASPMMGKYHKGAGFRPAGIKTLYLRMKTKPKKDSTATTSNTNLNGTEFPKKTKCSLCKGTGIEIEKMKGYRRYKCHSCEGIGEITHPFYEETKI